MLRIDELRPPAASQRLGSAFLAADRSISARPSPLSGQTPTMQSQALPSFRFLIHSILHFLPFFWCRVRDLPPAPSLSPPANDWRFSGGRGGTATGAAWTDASGACWGIKTVSWAAIASICVVPRRARYQSPRRWGDSTGPSSVAHRCSHWQWRRWRNGSRWCSYYGLCDGAAADGAGSAGAAVAGVSC